jgi:hypothetical protein
LSHDAIDAELGAIWKRIQLPHRLGAQREVSRSNSVMSYRNWRTACPSAVRSYRLRSAGRRAMKRLEQAAIALDERGSARRGNQKGEAGGSEGPPVVAPIGTSLATSRLRFKMMIVSPLAARRISSLARSRNSPTLTR